MLSDSHTFLSTIEAYPRSGRFHYQPSQFWELLDTLLTRTPIAEARDYIEDDPLYKSPIMNRTIGQL